MLPGRPGNDSQVRDRSPRLHLAVPAPPPPEPPSPEPPPLLPALSNLRPLPAAAGRLQGLEHGSTAAWSIADDVFQARYQAGGSHIEGAWQPLPQLSLQLDAATAAGSTASSRQRARQAQRAQRRPTSSAAAALPAEEPWLLAASAYASDGGGWTAGRTATTRARMLFQYKPYSQQEPLGASEAEVATIVEAVFGRWGSGPSAFEVSAAHVRWVCLAALACLRSGCA